MSSDRGPGPHQNPTTPDHPPVINIGIVAHVDAGKTSLTERLLHLGGAIDTPGRVDHGTTVTDGLELERRRGITIRTAVAALDVDGVQVNLIDTPGHADFVAEVERAFAVLDGVIVVVSAVEGVQAHTRVLHAIIAERRLPMLFFVNKTDRRGADPDRVIGELERRLTRGVVPLTGDWAAAFDEIAAESRAGLVHPLLTGSALTGQGVDRLLAVIPRLFPRAVDRRPPEPESLAATVFSVDRRDGTRAVLARMRTGTATLRRPVVSPTAEGKLTGVEVLRPGGFRRSDAVGAGEVVRLRGIGAAVGETITDADPPAAGTGRATGAAPTGFGPPGLEVTVHPSRPDAGPALHHALSELADEDPWVGLRVDPVSAALTLTLYGEVQQEVIASRLDTEYGVHARFGAAVTVHQERLAGTATAHELKGAPTNPFLAQVGLRIEPLPVGAGRSFELEIELGSMPPAFFTAVRDTVDAVLDEGAFGWPVADVRTVMTHSGYFPRQSAMHAGFDKTMSSTGADFRGLTTMIMERCLAQAGTLVEEPVDAFELHVPEEHLAAVLDQLARARGIPYGTGSGEQDVLVTGQVPAAEVGGLRRRLPDLSSGEAVLLTRFHHWAAVTDDPEQHRRRRVPVSTTQGRPGRAGR